MLRSEGGRLIRHKHTKHRISVPPPGGELPPLPGHKIEPVTGSAPGDTVGSNPHPPITGSPGGVLKPIYGSAPGRTTGSAPGRTTGSAPGLNKLPKETDLSFDYTPSNNAVLKGAGVLVASLFNADVLVLYEGMLAVADGMFYLLS